MSGLDNAARSVSVRSDDGGGNGVSGKTADGLADNGKGGHNGTSVRIGDNGGTTVDKVISDEEANALRATLTDRPDVEREALEVVLEAIAHARGVVMEELMQQGGSTVHFLTIAGTGQRIPLRTINPELFQALQVLGMRGCSIDAITASSELRPTLETVARRYLSDESQRQWSEVLKQMNESSMVRAERCFVIEVEGWQYMFFKDRIKIMEYLQGLGCISIKCDQVDVSIAQTPFELAEKHILGSRSPISQAALALTSTHPPLPPRRDKSGNIINPDGTTTRPDGSAGPRAAFILKREEQLPITIESLQAQIAKMQESIDSINLELAKNKQKLGHRDNALGRNAQKLSVSKENLERLQGELADKVRELEALQGQLAVLQSSTEAQVQELNRRSQELDNVQIELDSRSQELDVRLNELNRAQEELGTRAGALCDREIGNITREKAIEVADARIASLDERLLARARSLKSDHDNIQTERDEIEGQRVALGSEMGELGKEKERLTQLSAVLAKRSDALDALQSQLTALEAGLDKRRTEIEQGEAELREQRNIFNSGVAEHGVKEALLAARETEVLVSEGVVSEGALRNQRVAQWFVSWGEVLADKQVQLDRGLQNLDAREGVVARREQRMKWAVPGVAAVIVLTFFGGRFTAPSGSEVSPVVASTIAANKPVAQVSAPVAIAASSASVSVPFGGNLPIETSDLFNPDISWDFTPIALPQAQVAAGVKLSPKAALGLAKKDEGFDEGKTLYNVSKGKKTSLRLTQLETIYLLDKLKVEDLEALCSQKYITHLDDQKTLKRVAKFSPIDLPMDGDKYLVVSKYKKASDDERAYKYLLTTQIAKDKFQQYYNLSKAIIDKKRSETALNESQTQETQFASNANYYMPGLTQNELPNTETYIVGANADNEGIGFEPLRFENPYAGKESLGCFEDDICKARPDLRACTSQEKISAFMKAICDNNVTVDGLMGRGCLQGCRTKGGDLRVKDVSASNQGLLVKINSILEPLGYSLPKNAKGKLLGSKDYPDNLRTLVLALAGRFKAGAKSEDFAHIFDSAPGIPTITDDEMQAMMDRREMLSELLG